MNKSTLGLHVVDGSKNGYGLTAPYARGVVSFIHGDIDKRLPNPEVSQDCFTVWRDIAQWAIDPTDPDSPTNSDAPPGLEQWTPAQARANARVQWPRTSARWKAHPASACKLTNEIGGSDRKVIENLIAFEDELMIINEEEGRPFTFLVASCAGDSPHWDSGVWQELFAPHIYKAWTLGHIYSRHAYCGVNESDNKLMIKDGKPADNNVNRPFREINYFLQTYNTCGPIVLGESGYVTYPGEPLYSEQMVAYDNYIRSQGYDQWIGFQCCFTYGEWWEANMQNSSQALGSWMSQNVPSKWEPSFDESTEPPTEPTPEPPTEVTTEEKIFNYSQSWAFPVNEDAALQAVAIDEGFTPSGVEKWETIDGVKYAMQPFYKIGDTNTKRSYYAVVGDWGNVKSTDGTTPNEVVLDIPHMSQNGPGADARRNDCGAACAAMDINGETVYAPTVDEIAIEYQTTPNAYMNFDEIKKALGDFSINGIKVRPIYAQDIAEEITDGYPVIALVWYQALPYQFSAFDGSHFIVIYGARDGELLYHDPLSLDSQVLWCSFEQMNEALAQVVNSGNMAYQAMICVKRGEPTEPEPPTGETIDLASRQVGIPTAFRVVKHVDDNGHETNEEIQDMWIDDNTAVMRKNVNGEWYRFDGGYRLRLLDTSPAPGFEGVERVYRMTQDNGVGGRVNPAQIELGKRWTDSTAHHVQFYAKAGCRELSENSGPVTSSCEATLEKNVTFNTYGQGLTFDEVVYVETNNDEKQMYGVYQGQKVGWIGWVAPWGTSEPVEVRFDRGVMTQEPNRYCSW